MTIFCSIKRQSARISPSLVMVAALLLLQCTGHKVQPLQPSAPVVAIEIPTASVQRLQTFALGERTAFGLKLCPDKKLLAVPIGRLIPSIQSSEGEPVSRVALSVPQGCEDLDALEPSLRNECIEYSTNCAKVFGLVNHPGPTILEFLGPSKNPKLALAAIARVALDLPQPTSSPSADAYDELMRVLAASERGRTPTNFSKYWVAKLPVVFPSVLEPKEGTSNSTVDTNPLWNPWFNSSHVIDDVNMAVLGGWLDPDESASVPVGAVVAPNAERYRSQVPTPKSVSPAMARWVPKEAAWAHFASAAKLLEVLDRLDDLVSGALLGVQHDGENRMLRARYLTALGVDEKVMRRLFESGEADDIGLVSHDLSLRDGTDLSLVIHLVANEAGQGQLKSMVSHVGTRANARIRTDRISSREISVAETKDGQVRSHLLFLGNWAVLANSRTALSRLLDAYDGKVPSMGTDAGYRYMRGTRSASADGMFYASDAYWEAQITAQRRVAHRRRLLCTGAMQVLSNAVLAFRRDRGYTPSMQQVTSAKYLFDDDLRCPDGGEIGLSSGAAHCSVHGRLASLNPVIEHLPQTIKPSERDGYLEYMKSRRGAADGDDDEQVDWEREFAFPMGVEFSLGDEFVATVKTLPNTQWKHFETVRKWAARNPTVFKTSYSLPNTISSLALSLNLEPKPKSDIGEKEESKTQTSEFDENGPFAIHRWLSGKGQLFVGDGATPFGFPLDRHATMGTSGSLLLGLKMWTSALYTVIMAPISGVVELKDSELARTAILTAMAVNAKEFSEFVDAYDLLPYRELTVHVLSVPWFHAYLYFAFLDKNLVFSNRKQSMLALVDQYLDGKHDVTPAYRGQASLELFPYAFDVTRETSENTWQANLRRSCQKSLASFDLLAQSFGPKLAANPEINQTYFGFDAKCPEGGSYRFDPAEGGAYCTVHGGPGHARQPIHLSEQAESRKLFRDIKHLAWTFGVSDYALETELRIEREAASGR